MKQYNIKTVPLIQYILFTILVVATPFVVVTKFLQGSVHFISHLTLSPFGIEIPVVVIIAISLFLGFILWQWKNISLRRIRNSLVVLAMIVLAHQVQDLYLGMSIYDLQMNWHYIAYSAYAFVFFRAFYVRGIPITKMIFVSVLSALAMSTFDELFQFFLSHRTFDVSDIAKDMWGAMMGVVLVLFVSETYGSVDLRLKSIRHKKIRDYFRYPLSALVIMGAFPLLLLLLSPLLTEHKYIGLMAIIVPILFVTLFTIIHLSQLRSFRIVLQGVIVLILLTLTGSFLVHRNANINYVKPNLIVYKGLPVAFLDLMIYPNGLPRLVDKKESFNDQDQSFLLKQEPDILLIGSGFNGKGGKGFHIGEGSTFLYNKYLHRGTQVIILKTPDACKVFNRLKREGKNVLFIIHNST